MLNTKFLQKKLTLFAQNAVKKFRFDPDYSGDSESPYKNMRCYRGYFYNLKIRSARYPSLNTSYKT